MEQSRVARDLLVTHSPAVQRILEERSFNRLQPPAEASESNEIPPDDDRIGDSPSAPKAAAANTAPDVDAAEVAGSARSTLLQLVQSIWPLCLANGLGLTVTLLPVQRPTTTDQ